MNANTHNETIRAKVSQGRQAWKQFAWLAVALFAPPASAQLVAEQARMDKCPEGYYSGPQAGQNRFVKDPYIWFVSKDFAKRFCMPESMVDETLKGALAIAVRVKDDEEVSCGFFAGRSDICPQRQKLVLEVYVDRKANIPKADPSVEFYIRRDFNSGRIISVDGAKARRRDQGKYDDVVGERAAFNPAHSQTISRKDWTRFLYLGVREGWASGSGDFIESYYRANWAEGIDLIGLSDGGGLGFGGLYDPDAKEAHPKDPDKGNPIRRYAIGVLKGDNAPGATWNSEYKKWRYPQDYLHVVEFPHRLAQLVYEFDQKTGAAFMNDARRSVAPPSPPASR
jgi:hypothetical protein